MEVPHPPQKKTAQKSKFWAQKTFENNWAINGFFWGHSESFGQHVK
jgi:hypothetical protein